MKIKHSPQKKSDTTNNYLKTNLNKRLKTLFKSTLPYGVGGLYFLTTTNIWAQDILNIDQTIKINAQKIDASSNMPSTGNSGNSALKSNVNASVSPAEVETAQVIRNKDGATKVTEQSMQQTTQKMDAQAYRSSPQDVVLKDASVLANYAPIGYYENFAIRGFALDLEGGYTQNNAPISARSMPSLINIEQIEINKGIAKEQSQISAGQINYRTKRPKNISQLQFGLQSSAAGNIEHHLQIDQGQKYQNWGYRSNFAYTRLDPYVENTRGRRYQGSLALDFQPTPLFKTQVDFNILQQTQPTTPGYMLLLDNNYLPVAIPRVSDRFYNLNQASWRKPMKTNHLDATLQTQYQINPHLKWQQTLSVQDTRTDDYVAFPYPFYENGQYELRDYRSENEQRQGHYIDQSLRAQFKTAAIEHQIRLGGNLNLYFNRQNDRFDYKRERHQLSNPSQILQTYSKIKTKPALSIKQLEKSLYLSDRLSHQNPLGTYQFDLGAKWSQITEKYTSSESGKAFSNQQSKNRLLPQIAINYQNPAQNLGLYASHQQSIRMGQLPETENSTQFLPARVLKQNEIGLYYLPKSDLRIQAAIFDLRRPYEYLDDNWEYQQNGQEIRRGVELAAQGRINQDLAINASLAYLWRATQKGVAMTTLNNQKASNVPTLKAHLGLDYRLGKLHPALDAYSSEIGFNFESGRNIDRYGQFKTPSHFTTDIALKYKTPSIFGQKQNAKNSYDTIEFGIKNLFDRRYWKDVSINYGEPYLHLGAPRSFYLQMNMGF
jgi:iron complex outermembrane recepter protein